MKDKEKVENFTFETVGKRHKNGESVKHLSKRFAINKKKVLELIEQYKEYERDKDRSCHKKHHAYNAVVEKRKGTAYESKLGGIPYISEDDKWVTCSKCGVEKVLILQLNISELPDVSEKLREWDFIQVSACMNPSQILLQDEEGYDDYEKLNYKGEETKARDTEFFAKRLESNRCYNIIERTPYFEFAYDELADGKNMFVGEPFNNYFDIKLVKKDKSAQSFLAPPWMDGYGLYKEGKKIVSNFHNDERDYSWVDGHYHFEKIMPSWTNLPDMKCELHYEHLEMCSRYNSFGSSDLLGILPWDRLEDYEWSVENEEDDSEILKCPECEKSLTLLFQFKVSREDNKLQLISEEDAYVGYDYALFYCEEHPEMMSCSFVYYDH